MTNNMYGDYKRPQRRNANPQQNAWTVDTDGTTYSPSGSTKTADYDASPALKLQRISGAIAIALFVAGLAIALAVNVQPHILAAKFLMEMIKEIPFTQWASIQTLPVALAGIALSVWLIVSQKQSSVKKTLALTVALSLSVVWFVVALLSYKLIAWQTIAVISCVGTSIGQIAIYFRNGVFFKSVLAYLRNTPQEAPEKGDTDATTRLIESRNKSVDKVATAFGTLAAVLYAYEIGISFAMFTPFAVKLGVAPSIESFDAVAFFKMAMSSLAPEFLTAKAVTILPAILAGWYVTKKQGTGTKAA
ncbi:MAG: hypothetical protein ACRC62_15375 [Microcoleus sp.]